MLIRTITVKWYFHALTPIIISQVLHSLISEGLDYILHI